MARPLTLLITTLLLISAVTTGSSYTVASKPEQSLITTTPSEPSLSEISVLSPPRNLCLEIRSPLDSTWPVEKAVKEWNKQFKVQLRIDSDDCYAVVPLAVQVLQGKWGETNYNKGKWEIFVSPAVPDMWKEHVLCHEFGHLLGLGHTEEVDSCMNIQLTYPRPSVLNLQEAGKNLWMFAE